MKRNFITILVLLFLAIFISGCIDILITPDEDLTVPGKGILKIYLTDSSGDYKAKDSGNYVAVNITISEIQVHIAGDDEGDEGEGKWIECQLINDNDDNGEVFNLIGLKYEDIVELLSETELEPGKYTQIRLFVTEASVVIEVESEGDEKSDSDVNNDDIVEPAPIDVEIPSGYQTGIKLIHPFEIIEGETTELTIDFDAEKSIIKTGNGNNGKYKLKPVIKVITN